MADFSTLFDEVKSRLATLFPSHTLITDPYELLNNKSFQMQQGYGLGIVPAGDNTELFLSKQTSYNVQLLVPIVRQYIGTHGDSSSRETVEKALMGDWEVLADDCHRNNMEISGTNIKGTSFDGIEALATEDGAKFFRAINVNLELEYVRNP